MTSDSKIYKFLHTNIDSCPFCFSKLLHINENDSSVADINCPVCGRYVFDLSDCEKLDAERNRLAAILYYSKQFDETRIIGPESFYNKQRVINVRPKFISIDSIDNLYPSKFSVRIENLLLDISKHSFYLGDIVHYPKEEFCSAAYIKRFDIKGKKLDDDIVYEQIIKILILLSSDEKDYAKGTYIQSSNSSAEVEIELFANGWARVENLEIQDKNNKDVFIAMAFGDETQKTRDALKKGISNAGFNPVLIDEVKHNHQIVPEMFKKIRESKFLVIDISLPNTGAYYEAGFALGLGKEVIFCCRKDSFNNPDKNMRPHFDVSQKQMLIWDDENDLAEKLEKWIKSLFN